VASDATTATGQASIVAPDEARHYKAAYLMEGSVSGKLWKGIGSETYHSSHDGGIEDDNGPCVSLCVYMWLSVVAKGSLSLPNSGSKKKKKTTMVKNYC
jgi:hypothetical protein